MFPFPGDQHHPSIKSTMQLLSLSLPLILSFSILSTTYTLPQGIQTHTADPAPTPAHPVPWNNEVVRDHGSLQDEKRTWKLPFRPQTQTASIPTWTAEPNLGNMDHHAFPQFNTSPRSEIRQTKNPPAVAKRLKSNKRFEHTGSQSLDTDTPPRVRPVRPPRPPGTTLRPPLDFVQPANRTRNGRTSRFTENIDSDNTNEPRNQALSARGENYSHEAPLESSDEHIETPPTPIRPRSPPPSTAAPASQTSATNSGGAPHRDALEHHLARIQALHDEWVEMVFLQGIQRSEDRRPRTTTPSSRPTGSPGHLKRSSTINTRSSSGEETSQGKPFSHDHSNYAKRGSPANRRADSGASDRAPVPHWRRPHSAPPLLGHKNPVDDPITPTTEGMEQSYLKYPAEHRGDSNTLGQQISHAGYTDGGNAPAQHIAQPPSPSPIPPDSPPAQEHGKRWSQRSLNEPDGTVDHMLDPRAFKFLKNLVSKKNKDKKGFVRLNNPSHSVSPPTSPPPPPPPPPPSPENDNEHSKFKPLLPDTPPPSIPELGGSSPSVHQLPPPESPPIQELAKRYEKYPEKWHYHGVNFLKRSIGDQMIQKNLKDERLHKRGPPDSRSNTQHNPSDSSADPSHLQGQGDRYPWSPRS